MSVIILSDLIARKNKLLEGYTYYDGVSAGVRAALEVFNKDPRVSHVVDNYSVAHELYVIGFNVCVDFVQARYTVSVPSKPHPTRSPYV